MWNNVLQLYLMARNSSRESEADKIFSTRSTGSAKSQNFGWRWRELWLKSWRTGLKDWYSPSKRLKHSSHLSPTRIHKPRPLHRRTRIHCPRIGIRGPSKEIQQIWAPWRDEHQRSAVHGKWYWRGWRRGDDDNEGELKADFWGVVVLEKPLTFGLVREAVGVVCGVPEGEGSAIVDVSGAVGCWLGEALRGWRGSGLLRDEVGGDERC